MKNVDNKGGNTKQLNNAHNKSNFNNTNSNPNISNNKNVNLMYSDAKTFLYAWAISVFGFMVFVTAIAVGLYMKIQGVDDKLSGVIYGLVTK